MEDPDSGFDRMLLLIIALANAGLFVLFLMTPVLRPYYAVLMPATIAAAAGTAWLALDRAQTSDGG